MPRATIGFIRNSRFPNVEHKKFEQAAEKIGVDLVVFNAANKMDIEQILSKAAQCDIILNNDTDYISLELAKTLEALGHCVSEMTSTYYYTEDKWMQYLKCARHGIPVPKTILLPTDIVSIKNELRDFHQFPVVLKRVEGFGGCFVDKADNLQEAVGVIRKFWKKGENKYPIIAQEFVDSQSYRVLTIGGRVVQTAIKRSNGWKATGYSATRFWKFKVDKELSRILNRLKKIANLDVCGYDFARHHGRWVLIEINAQPSYTCFTSEHDRVIEEVLKYFAKLALNRKRKARQ